MNSSASSPRALLPAPLIDFFCGEVPHNAASTQVPTEPAFVFRLVESLKRRQTATASGHDWAWIKANEKQCHCEQSEATRLVRTWIAQTYAFGSVFMVPHRQWCYTPELGTHWWHGRPEDFAYIYRFVREHASLLDGYVRKPHHRQRLMVSLAKTALIYTNVNFSEIRDAALKLTEANIPYTIIIADDEDLSMRLTAEAIALYEYIIVGSKPLLDEQEEILGRAKAKVVRWEGLSALPNAVKNHLAVESSDRVRVSIRYNPDDSNAPIVCHLLNQNYELEKDDVHSVDIRVTLKKDLVAKAIRNPDIHTAVIHIPNREPVRLPVVKTDDCKPLASVSLANTISFEVKDLGLWAIVELRRER